MCDFKFYNVRFDTGSSYDSFSANFSSKEKAVEVLTNNLLLKHNIYFRERSNITREHEGKRVKFNDDFSNETYKNNLKLSFNEDEQMTYEMTIKFSLEEEVEIPEVKMEGVPYQKGRVEYKFLENKEVVVKGTIYDSGYQTITLDYEPTFSGYFIDETGEKVTLEKGFY